VSKQNCWEAKKCGREPGGKQVAQLGVCPAAAPGKAAGVHGGSAGGRACWMIAGTFCGGKLQGTFAAKAASCSACAFYLQVRAEEGPALLPASRLLQLLN
jgi:hypothetical protein